MAKLARSALSEAQEGIAPRGTAEGADELDHVPAHPLDQGPPIDRRALPADGDGRAFLVRLFGWSMVWLFPAYLASTVLSLSFNYPGPEFTSAGGLFQLALYAAAIVLAAVLAARARALSLRVDAEHINRFNTYLIRGCFFAVLFVGLGDMAISFLRVENLLDAVVGGELTTALGRSAFRGPWVHVPLIAAGFVVALFARTLGFHWLALMIVVAELAIVVTRFVFSYEQAFMGDLVRLWYAALFLFASAYTLIEEGHVRVDILYAGFTSRRKGTVNALGTILLGITLCWTIIVVSFSGASAVVYGVVSRFEISQSGFGLYTKYLMAAFLAVFAVTMLFQFVAYLFDAVADRRGRPGSRIGGAAPAH